MIAWDDSYTWIAFLAALYVWTCYRVAGHVKPSGHRRLNWFFISLFCTPIPITILLLRDLRHQRNAARDAAAEARQKAADFLSSPPAVQASRQGSLLCPHCGKRIAAGEADTAAGVKTCPWCHLTIDEARYA